MRVSRLFFISLLLVLLAKEGTAGPRKRKLGDPRTSRADTSLPANVFRQTITGETKRLLLFPARFRGVSNQDMAEFIAENLEQLRDPDRDVPPFGVAYSVAVWDATIPAEYQYAVRTGNPFYSEGKTMRNYMSIQGATCPEVCYKKPSVTKTGVLGWPCTGGGLVVLQASTSDADEKSVAVFFQPRKRLGHKKSKMAILNLTKELCLSQQMGTGGPVDLTLLSTCIYVNYPTGLNGQLNRALQTMPSPLPAVTSRLKGIAVIPSFVSGSAYIGFSSEVGGIIKAEDQWLGDSRLIFVALPALRYT